jgi:hypothetical protein
MAEVFIPPIQPVAGFFPALGFSITVTTNTGAIVATNYDCLGVLIQSSSLNDSNASVTGKMFVEISGVKSYELVQGESVFVPCSNTSEVKVITQSGTAWARGFIYRALKQ